MLVRFVQTFRVFFLCLVSSKHCSQSVKSLAQHGQPNACSSERLFVGVGEETNYDSLCLQNTQFSPRPKKVVQKKNMGSGCDDALRKLYDIPIYFCVSNLCGTFYIFHCLYVSTGTRCDVISARYTYIHQMLGVLYIMEGILKYPWV